MSKLRHPFKEIKREITKIRFNTTYTAVPFLNRFKRKKKSTIKDKVDASKD